ncbi:MAG: pyridoxal phosphate-dependent aminotransferase [Calditrichaeota bacterium]|nr:MAG: pyridoxal phosphate-dependent aminotransferase [Calditrichota bacterium]
MKLSKRIEYIQPSQTLAVTTKVDKLRRAGRDVIDLGAGEPDFDTPEIIKKEAIKAIENGMTKYTPSTGIFELKEAICEKLWQDNGLKYSPSQIVVTCGAKHAIINTLLALCERGDEVIIASPYWTSYPEQIRFVEAQPVIIQTGEEHDFKIQPEQLNAALNNRTKMIIFNSPSNPTGCVYTYEELQSLVEILAQKDIYILSDEIYEKIIYDGYRHVSLASFEEIKDRVVLINGVSKAFAMTGWRIGYLAAPTDVVKAVSKIQSHSTSNPCSISQWASVAALKAGDTLTGAMLEAFDQRRKFMVKELNDLNGIYCREPKGAFYLFPNISDLLGKSYKGGIIQSAMDFCSYVLEEVSVALVPGEAFGSKKHVRISYATSLDNLEESIIRLRKAIESLQDSS